MSPSGKVAVLIDDERQLRSLLKIVLESENYRVYEAADGKLGLQEIIARKPDVIILDLGLPDMNGLDVLRRLREWCSAPVLILSVRDSKEEKVNALDLGADDYVTKPFGSEELLARLRAIQRRNPDRQDNPIFECGKLQIDFSKHEVCINGIIVKLTSTEFSLLRLLSQHAGKVMTQRQLLREIWGPQAEHQGQYLRLYITYLRRKLFFAQDSIPRIQTEPRIGYRLVID